MTELLDTDLRFSIVPEWVLDAELTDRAIRIYALIARYADSDTLQAFPSRDTLAGRAKCSVKSVDRAIRELVQVGALTKSHRIVGEAYSSNLYTVKRIPPTDVRMVKGVGTPQSPPRDTGDARVGTPVTPPRDTTVPLTITSELEPLERKPIKSVETDFDRFWEIYPVKKDKPRSRRAFQSAVKRVGLDVILDGARRYRDDPNRVLKYTKNPSTWLNNDAWENPPEPSREEPRKLSNAEKAARLALELEVRSVPLQVEQAPEVLEVETTSFDWIGRDPNE